MGDLPLAFWVGGAGGGVGKRREEEMGAVGGRTAPEEMRRRRELETVGGRCGRISWFRWRAVVVVGEGMRRGRSGREEGKRIMRLRGVDIMGR